MKNKYAVKPLSLTVINFVVAHDLMALGSVKYRKIAKISPGLLFFKGPF